MDVNIMAIIELRIMFCLIKIGICWEYVKVLLLKAHLHCDVVLSLKWNYDGILYFMNI